MNSILLSCFLISLLAFCSCKKSKKEKLYDKMAAEFCDCYQKSTAGSDNKFSDCIIKVTSNNEQALTEVGVGKQYPKEYNQMINEAFFSKQRMNHYCPEFLTDLKHEFEDLKAKSKIKLRLTGVFSSQQKSGKRMYLLYLKDQKDSGIFFWSKDSIDPSLIKQNISIVYHQMGSNNFVDSINLK